MPYKDSSKCKRRRLFRMNRELKQYINENIRKKIHIVTTRFTNETWSENKKYCEKLICLFLISFLTLDF